MVPEETLRTVREKAELLNGGASLGETGDALAEIAVQRAMAYCQRRDVPEDMEQAVAALLLALHWTVPQNAGASGDTKEDDGETPSEDPGPAGDGGSAGNPEADWEALIAAGAVKSVQRGDTAITFNTSATEALSSALSGSGAAHPTVQAALAELAPWRRLGRLRRPPPERGPGHGE